MKSNFYGCFRHETCGREDCSKITEFSAKTTLHGHRSVDVDDDPDLLKKVITGNESWLFGYETGTKALSSQCKAFCYD